MKFKYECLDCNVKQAIKVCDIIGVSEEKKEIIVRKTLSYLSEMDYEISNPTVMVGTWQIIVDETGNEDPYEQVKEEFNAFMLPVFDKLYEELKDDPDRFEKGVHLAIEGNIIDYGANHSFSQEEVMERLRNCENTVLGFDDSEALYKALKEAKSLLYLGDNCGEIVLDRLFIEILKLEFPELDIKFAVRGQSILNDCLMKDAVQVGMTETVEVIHNGDNTPGTDLSRTSDAFRETFNAADVIIAKGQGNFESLDDAEEENIFFLLMAKCQLVAGIAGVKYLDKICMKKKAKLF